MAKEKLIQHLLWRAGFSEKPEIINQYSRQSIKKNVKQLLKDSENFEPINVVDKMDIYSELQAMKKDTLLTTEQRRKQLNKMIKEEEGALNIAWINKMVDSKAVLREKMALFWHGHFACRTRNPLFAQHYLNTIRQHALGKFGDLLMAVSKEPAMLQFLNNQQNKKKSPNENFAREVMELFTLGRGNYSEHDVKEAARAFTGWEFDRRENGFFFNTRQHDFETKEFLGKTGKFDGEDIIKMILAKKETANFIVSKIYKNFVNEQIDTKIVQELSAHFYKNDYDISDLMETIFTSSWFYDVKNIGTHIKSPVELLVSLQRSTGSHFVEKQSLLFIQRVLGQVILYPPNVAGWAGGKNWIDSSSLLFRMQLPYLAFNNSIVRTVAKSDGDVNTDFQTKKGKKNTLETTMNWEVFSKQFTQENRKELLDELEEYFLQVSISEELKKGFIAKMEKENQPEAIKKMVLALMMLPEYQLC
ncbi:DUF1800 domain-containing protein [Arcicella sp. DC2W]|uniref:DUF1800 domain-containing protein n=1 Tax=Arcicella gelida TaxID=2984195 RepID=A0ABU5RYT7_9BACT|nr:DUF1800 domain-containing protein [Arcicella sp. DC2W]MEA5401380.1 DUF1800 domain-containing protein [Arcicella sp. DC2W]